MVPDRLSYSEMYLDVFKYPSEWTLDWDHYVANRAELCGVITEHMDYYPTRIRQIKEQAASLTANFFSATDLLRNLK
jgi:hypothetical protein